ncbi:hypothetical protein BH11ACT4_BH11ACT4_22350 [soil metagenome]
MSLNQNFSGAALMPGRQKLDGSERGLDALVGLVIFLAEVLVGFLAVYALYLFGRDAVATSSSAASTLETGFLIALAGSVAVVAVTTLVFLVRLARGRRSWPAPLWGLILLSVACGVGYFVMAG